MATVFLLHWNRSEAEERAASLRSAGHTISVHWSTEESPRLRDSLPDIAVISLDRLPSHGRAVAEWLWEAKKRQHIPIVFSGGEPGKVAATREKFPRAVYCATHAIPEVVSQQLGTTPTEGGQTDDLATSAKPKGQRRTKESPESVSQRTRSGNRTNRSRSRGD